MVQLSIKNLKKDTPATYAFAGTLFTAWGSTIAGYGLTASNAVVGFIGLGCALIGVTLTIFSNKKQSNSTDGNTITKETVTE